MLRHILTPALAGLLLGSSPAFAQSEGSFGDWTAGCDNVRRCAAVGFSDEIGSAWIRVDRGGESGAGIEIRLIVSPSDEVKELALTTKFDEPGFTAALPEALTIKADESGVLSYKIPESALPAFRDALRKATSLILKRADGKPFATDTPEVKVSLKGSIATLRWIDDQQKRANTVTAYVASGPAAASTVPSPPAVPTIRAARFKAKSLGQKAPPAVVAAWKQACDEWDDRQDAEHEGYTIGPKTALWIMPCSRGAYNYGSMMFLLRDGGKAELLKFEDWEYGDKDKGTKGRFVTSSEELINVAFSEDDLTLSYFSKGRGIGDCGSAAQYVWDGSRFRLTSYKNMGECKGVPEDFWLTLWQAQIVR